MANYQELVAAAAKKGLSEADVKTKAQALGIDISDAGKLSYNTPESQAKATEQVYGKAITTPVRSDIISGAAGKGLTAGYAVRGEKIDTTGNITDKVGVVIKPVTAITPVKSSTISGLSPLVKQVSADLGDKNGTFENMFNTAAKKAEENYNIFDTGLKSIQNSFGLMESGQAEKYKDIVDRLSLQERNIDDKFIQMRQNLDTIKTGYTTGQEAQEQAANIATSRQLRGVGGGAGQAITSGLGQSRARTAMLNMAKLDTELSKATNELEQNYLTLKNSIVSDQNLNDRARMELLSGLDEKFKAITQMQIGGEQKLIEDVYAPIQQAQAAMTNVQLSQYANTANQKWLNTSPDVRESQIQQILGSALSANVKIPSEVVQTARGLSTATDMMNYIYNYILNNVPKSSVNNSVLNAMIALNQNKTTEETTTQNTIANT